jgi:hypothetical protein
VGVGLLLPAQGLKDGRLVYRFHADIV